MCRSDVMPPRRQEFPTKVKAQAFRNCNGYCQGCGIKLTIGNVEYDHDTPDGLGGEAKISNCRVLCRTCHSKKTHSVDRPKMAKADRVRKKAFGIKRSGWQSKYKKKINGEVVERD
jgi:5-methylcytosine-specific restriction endonuclease McrA